jgi:hypothetical protein
MKVTPGLYKLRDGRLVNVTVCLATRGWLWASPLEDKNRSYVYQDDTGSFLQSPIEHEWDLVQRVDLF